MKPNKKIFLILLIINFLCINIVVSEGEKVCAETPDQTCEKTETIETKNKKDKNKNKKDSILFKINKNFFTIYFKIFYSDFILDFILFLIN